MACKVTHDRFVWMLTGQAGLKETLSTEYLAVSGSRLDPLSFLMLLNQPKGNFDTVAP